MHCKYKEPRKDKAVEKYKNKKKELKTKYHENRAKKCADMLGINIK